MDAIDAKRNNRYSVTLFLTTPIRSKITYYVYVGFCFGWVFPCSSSIYRGFTNDTISKRTYKRTVQLRRRDKTADASLWSGLFDVHSFKGHLFTDCACSERTYSRYVQLRRRNTSRNGGEQISAELDGCTSDCAVLLRSRRTKRGGIMSERYLSMRVPPVFPASDG